MGETPNRIKGGISSLNQVGSHSFNTKAPGDTVVVTARVQNSGDTDGIAVLKVTGPSGGSLASRNALVKPGQTITEAVSFQVPSLSAGTHQFSIALSGLPGGNLMGHSFAIVIAAAPTTTVTPTGPNLFYVDGSLTIS